MSPFGVAALIFSQGQILAINFDKAYSLAARLSKDLRNEVERQTAEVKTIMNTIPQGILIINSSGHIAPVMSVRVKDILHNDHIEGEMWSDILLGGAHQSEDQKQISKATMSLILNANPLNFQVNQDHLPVEIEFTEGSAKGVCLELTWSPLVGKSNTVESMLVTIFDATQKKMQEMKAQKNEYEIRLVRELVAIPMERYHSFCDASQAILAELEYLVMSAESKSAEVLRKIYLNTHTLKGVSRTLGLQSLSNALHDIESVIEALQKDGQSEANWQLLQHNYQQFLLAFDDYLKVNDQLLGRVKQDYSKMYVPRSIIEECRGYLTRIEKVLTDPLLRSQNQKMAETMVRLTHVSLHEILDEATGDLKKIAQDLGKPCPTISLVGEPVFITSKVAQTLRNALVHLLRNAMDHGIEDAAERVAQGKKPEGHISFSWTTSDHEISLNISDDGRGLAMKEVMNKGLEYGILSQEESRDPAQVMNLIFHPSFSTARRVTQFSGRGIGMNAVRSYVEEIGGLVEIHAIGQPLEQNYLPFRVELRIPLENGAIFQLRARAESECFSTMSPRRIK